MAQKNPVKNYDAHKTLNDLRKNMNAAIEDFAKQEDEVTIAKRDPKTGKVVKKEVKAPRYLVIMEVLYEKAKRADISAIKEWNTRVLGIPVQRIEHSGQIENTGEAGSSVALSTALEAYKKALKKEVVEEAPKKAVDTRKRRATAPRKSKKKE